MTGGVVYRGTGEGLGVVPFFTIHGSWRAEMRIRHGQRCCFLPSSHNNAHTLQSVSERPKLSMCVGRDTEVHKCPSPAVRLGLFGKFRTAGRPHYVHY